MAVSASSALIPKDVVLEQRPAGTALPAGGVAGLLDGQARLVGGQGGPAGAGRAVRAAGGEIAGQGLDPALVFHGQLGGGGGQFGLDAVGEGTAGGQAIER